MIFKSHYTNYYIFMRENQQAKILTLRPKYLKQREMDLA